MRRPKIQSTALWLVTISGFEGQIYFTRVSGLQASRPMERIADGFSRERRAIPGKVEYADVTLEKPADPGIDTVLMSWVIDDCRDHEEAKFEIALTPVSACGNEPTGPTIRLVGCIVQSVTLGDIDMDGSGVAMTQMVVSPTSIK